MIIPVGDRLAARRFPFVNWAIIAANVAVFVYMLTLSDSNRFIYDWGLVSACFAEHFGIDSGASARDLAAVCPPGNRELVQPFTSMFVHAGPFHIFSNLLFLWIFGDNVEDSMGHRRYLVFYVLCGLAGSILQTVLALGTVVPTVGASGAIAGIMGAYLVLFPKQGIRVVMVPLIFMTFTVPAVFMIGFWYLTQVFAGVASIADATAGTGVAWWAHVGGFSAGVTLIWLFRRRRRVNPLTG